MLPLYDTLALARALLGTVLVKENPDGTRLAGRIVETEAYLHDDPGCHAFRGQTKRNATMFDEAGCFYVYLIYGMYHCLNVVSNKSGLGEAVLIRAIQPLEGQEEMATRRNTDKVRNLCSGPGKLMQAFGLDLTTNGQSVFTPPLHIVTAAEFGIDIDTTNDNKTIAANTDIVVTTRIGLSTGSELPYRFYLRDNVWISKK